MSLRRLAAATVVALLGSGLAACSDPSVPAVDDSHPKRLTVYAASSLKPAFDQLGSTFEDAHPGTLVDFNYAGSSDLVAQIEQGAPADVFASADTKNMEKLGAAAVDPADFATNTLEIAVPPDNPAHVTRLDDLARPGVQLVTCAPQVPCGAAAALVEAGAKLDWKPVSEEQSVADVLGKVESGEADAGLVYVTDVKAAGDKVEGIEIPAAVNATNTYPIASLEGAKDADLAAAWVAYVTGPAGQRVLREYGFGRA
ncbi:molybdate-binding protein [Nocardioides phosphati]|uniref:Molybdate-binding protein n=1 Tax=Nocardioides phosphati TaxID=1867775 RepID=A0ABQ2NB88_9ACTN|nr:molybdate ABC transporter substrate-binding protein [Nocardioides phosphati]GGO90777.1 molybdate-binding protein [Nocardioides phosphati]